MARIERRLPQNVEGDFFVDDSCIDCDACRQIAPDTFRDHGDQSSVGLQPSTPEGVHRALLALVACPTASIGTTSPGSRRGAREAARTFPTNVVDNVYFCGYTSEASFGAWSYLIVRSPEAGGNILVDSPRFAAPLVRRIEEMGGVASMFLSHRDDIADHAKFAAHFHCPRVMHEGDGAARLGIEQVIGGEVPVALGAESGLHSDAGPHARPPGAAVPGPVAVHRQSSRVVAHAPHAYRLPRRLLVFMAGPDALDGAAARLSLRMGAAGARPDSRRFGSRDARAPRPVCELDEGCRLSPEP